MPFVALLWIFARPVLLAVGQTPEVAEQTQLVRSVGLFGKRIGRSRC